jgi:uncharacterized protein (TIGR02996 family)
MHDDSFLRELLANPQDRQTRQVYADWLEERGDPRGEFLRIEDALAALPKKDPSCKKLQARLRELRAVISPEWLAQLDRTRIENCEVRFEFQCPKRWEKLQVTDAERVRYCDSCHKNVYHCTSVEEAQEHADRGECVAVDSRVVRTAADLICPTRMMRIGRIAPREEAAVEAMLQRVRSLAADAAEEANRRRRDEQRQNRGRGRGRPRGRRRR